MKKINRTYSFTEETLRQLKEIMSRYEKENTSEVIRGLIENEYNRLKNPSAKADTKDSRLTDIETSLTALTAKLNDLNRMTYEVRDITNSYALMLESGEMEMNFHSADENVRDANLSSCLVKSKFVRLCVPLISPHPNGNKYSISQAAFA